MRALVVRRTKSRNVTEQRSVYGCRLIRLDPASLRVKATMGPAFAAREPHGSFQGLPRPVQANSDVALRRANGNCSLLTGFTSQVHSTQDFSVLIFQSRNELAEAGAPGAVEIIHLSCAGFQRLCRVVAMRFPHRRLPSVVVDENRFQNLAEPRPGRLRISDLIPLGHHLQIKILQDVLSLVSVAKPALQIAKVFGVVFGKDCGQFRCKRSWQVSASRFDRPSVFRSEGSVCV